MTFVESLIPIWPAVGLLLAGCGFLAVGLLAPNDRLPSATASGRWAGASLCVQLLIWGTWWYSSTEGHDNQLFLVDNLSRNGVHIAMLAGCMIAAIAIKLTPPRFASEFHCAFLFLVAGLVLLSGAADLTSLYLGLELVSIPTVLILSVSRRDDLGRESTLKYFALSAFSTAIFLMGASYLYGIAGTTSLAGIQTALASSPSTIARVAMALLLAGLAFRITAVPFHFYAPDVFSGSSFTAAAILSTLPKLAGFIAIIRLLGGDELNIGLAPTAELPLVVLALVTMTIGNCAALLQTSARRLLAYSSVAHSGYLLLGLAAILQQGGSVRPIMAYLSAYFVMTLGVFAGLDRVIVTGREDPRIEDLRGLATANRLVGASLTICLLSYIGVPLTAGFWAKVGIFEELVSASNGPMMAAAVVMAINAAVAAVYYLGLIISINSPAIDRNRTTAAGTSIISMAEFTCIACATLTLLWFLIPQWMST
jgi:NADH-quinone oxidoreductase subunit N